MLSIHHFYSNVNCKFILLDNPGIFHHTILYIFQNPGYAYISHRIFSFDFTACPQ